MVTTPHLARCAHRPHTVCSQNCVFLWFFSTNYLRKKNLSLGLKSFTQAAACSVLHCRDGVWSWVVHSGCMCGSFDERHIFVACSCAHTRAERHAPATCALHARYTRLLYVWPAKRLCCMHMHMLHVHVHAPRGWGSVNHTVTSRLPLGCHTLKPRANHTCLPLINCMLGCALGCSLA